MKRNSQDFKVRVASLHEVTISNHDIVVAAIKAALGSVGLPASTTIRDGKVVCLDDWNDYHECTAITPEALEVVKSVDVLRKLDL